MKLRNIALNNLRRRMSKTSFLFVTFLLVVGTTVTLNAIAASLKQEMDKKASSYGANIVISPKSEHLNLSYGGLSIPGVTYNVKLLNTSDLEKLKQIKDYGSIKGIAPKVIGTVSSGNQKYLAVGVDFNTELAMKSSWKVQGSIPGPSEVVIGSRLAARDKNGVGDKLQLADREVLISGVMDETGSSIDAAVLGNFDLVRELTRMGQTFNLIEINARNPESVSEEIMTVLPEAKVASVSQLVQGTAENAGRFATFSLYITVLMGLIGTLVVMVTLAGNVNDSSRELGIFRAIGFRQKHVLEILLTEVLVVSLAGGIVGYLLGILMPVFIGTIVTGQKLTFNWYPLLGLITIAAACVIGLLSVAYPAWRIAKLDPAEALRII